MADFHRSVEAAEVGKDGNAEGLDAAMVSHDHLRDRRHAHGIAAQNPIHLVFGRSLEGGALHTYIYTVSDTDLLFAGNLRSELDQFLVVGLMHIRETGTGGEILTAQRMLWEEVDVVGDDHQVAYVETFVHASGGVGYEQSLYAQLIHHTDREGHFFHGVAFIEMEASLHGENVDVAELAEDQFTAMSLHRRYGEVGYFGIRNLLLVSYF